jgi:hypothetical protein
MSGARRGRLVCSYLENLGKRLDDARIFVTIHLDDIDESDFGLCTVTEWLDDGGIFLRGGLVGCGFLFGEKHSRRLRAEQGSRSGRAVRSSPRTP